LGKKHWSEKGNVYLEGKRRRQLVKKQKKIVNYPI